MKNEKCRMENEGGERTLRMEFGDYIIDVDAERTRTFYATYPGTGCDCTGCRNYERVAETFPDTIKDFFHSLGLDPKKPSELYIPCTIKGGLLWYGGFYHLCGTLIQSAQPDSNGECHSFPVTDYFLVSFSEHIDLLEKDLPTPALQLNIDATLPWLLDGNYTY